MVMGTIFGEAADTYSSLDPLSEDPNALWEQEQEEIRRQEQAAYLGYQQSQSHFPIPAPAPPTPAPPTPAPAPTGGINPTQGGFRDPVYNPPNVTPGDQYAPNPDMGIFTPFRPINEAIQPYVQPAAELAGEAVGIGFQTQNLLGALGSGGQGYNPDTAGATGRFIGQALVPQSVEEGVINAAFGGGVTGFDDVIRGATALRGVADNVVRGAFPEQGLTPGFGAGIPNPRSFDPLSDVPPPDLGQGPQMLGGETPAPGGRLYQPEAEPFRGAPAPLPAEGLPGGIVDRQAFQISQMWAENQPNALLNDLNDTQVKTALYNAGLDSSGGPGAVRARYAEADAAGVKLPLDQPPSDLPDAFDLARRGVTPQSPTQAAPVVDETADQMRAAFEETRRQEQILTGGGSTPSPPSAPPPEPQMSDALRLLHESRVRAEGFQIAHPRAIELYLNRLDDLARLRGRDDIRELVDEARSLHDNGFLGQGQVVSERALQELHIMELQAAREQARLIGGELSRAVDDLTGGGVPDQPISASAARGDVGPSPSTPPPASPPPPSTPPPTPPPSDAGRHWFDDPRFPLRPEATPPPQVHEVQQAVEDALRETPSALRAVEPEGVRLVRDAVNRAEAELGVYAKPGAVERAVNAVVNPATGRYSDSFLNEVIRRDQLLRTALEDTRTTLGDIDARLADFRETLVKQHYPGNRERQQDALNAIEKHFADAESLRKDMAGWNRVADSVKNSVFGMADFGIMGQSGLAGLAQSGPQVLIGMANRLALAAHSLPAMKWLPAVDLEKTYHLPRKLILQNMGLDYNTSASLVQKGAGSPLSLIPGLQGLDKRTIGGLIEKSSDLQFNTIGGFFKTMDAEGSLASNYTLKFLGELARTGSLDTAKQRATDFILNAKNQREIMTKVNNDWSAAQRATTPGRQEVEKQVILSPSFFRSKINRMSDLANIAKPGASETQRMLAAQAIMAQAVFVLGAYQVINDQIGIGEAVTDPFKAGFGTVTLPWRNSEGERIKVSLVPQRSFQNVITRTMNATKDGDPKAAADAWTRYGFGSLNLFPRAVTSATGYGYDSQGRFHSPFGGERMSLAEAGKANIPVPPVAQNVISGTTTDVASQAITAGGFSTYGQSLGSEAFSERNEAAQIKSQALMDGNLLRAAFPNNPEVAAQLQGQEWRALEWHEQQAIIRAMSPEQRAQLEEAERVSAAANKASPTALGNAIAIRQATDVKEDERRAETKAKADALMAGLMDGSLKPQAVAAGTRILKDVQNEDLARIRWEGSTTYTGLPWKDREGQERLPSQFETALQQYKSIGGKVADVPDGKGGTRFDYDGLTRAQAAFMTVLGERDPATKARLDFYLQDKAERAEADKPELFKLYDNISARTQEYWRLPTGTGEKTQWLREHPMEDALLNMIGWMPVIHSPEAARMLIELTPGRTK